MSYPNEHSRSLLPSCSRCCRDGASTRLRICMPYIFQQTVNCIKQIIHIPTNENCMSHHPGPGLSNSRELYVWIIHGSSSVFGPPVTPDCPISGTTMRLTEPRCASTAHHRHVRAGNKEDSSVAPRTNSITLTGISVLLCYTCGNLHSIRFPRNVITIIYYLNNYRLQPRCWLS